MIGVDGNRLTAYAEKIQQKIDAGGQDGALSTPEKLESFEKSMDISFEEHFSFQNVKSEAFMAGKISQDEAQLIYAALGEVMSSENGGWQPHVTLAMKVTITNIMTELLSMKIRQGGRF